LAPPAASNDVVNPALFCLDMECDMGNATARQTVAADVMQRDMITVSPSDTLRDALELMTVNHVTGLPVMDSKSRCIGLITASDILGFEEEHAEASSDQGTLQHFNPELRKWESVPISAFGLEEFGDVRVEEVMTRDLIQVARDTPLKEVAQTMLDADVHRVLVMDEKFNLYGIISSFDFVRVMAGR
jgi:CBS domain-containing protein